MEYWDAEIKEWIIRKLPRWIEERPALRQQLADALSGAPVQLHITYEEFLNWADADTWAEWVNGEVVRLRVEWLWQEPLPPTIRTLAQIAGVDETLIEAFEQALGRA